MTTLLLIGGVKAMEMLTHCHADQWKNAEESAKGLIVMSVRRSLAQPFPLLRKKVKMVRPPCVPKSLFR